VRNKGAANRRGSVDKVVAENHTRQRTRNSAVLLRLTNFWSLSNAAYYSRYYSRLGRSFYRITSGNCRGIVCPRAECPSCRPTKIEQTRNYCRQSCLRNYRRQRTLKSAMMRNMPRLTDFWFLFNWTIFFFRILGRVPPGTVEAGYFYRLDALPVAQPTVSEHWRGKKYSKKKGTLKCNEASW